jgi:hypothetical protein
MIGKIDKTPQLSIFEVPLIQFINMKHELVELSRQIDWNAIEKQFTVYYTDFGRPSVQWSGVSGETDLQRERRVVCRSMDREPLLAIFLR